MPKDHETSVRAYKDDLLIQQYTGTNSEIAGHRTLHPKALPPDNCSETDFEFLELQVILFPTQASLQVSFLLCHCPQTEQAQKK